MTFLNIDFEDVWVLFVFIHIWLVARYCFGALTGKYPYNFKTLLIVGFVPFIGYYYVMRLPKEAKQ